MNIYSRTLGPVRARQAEKKAISMTEKDSGGPGRGRTPRQDNGLAPLLARFVAFKENGNFDGFPHPGEVYFISDGELVKIGYSGAAEVRRTKLQSANGRPLVILGAIRGTPHTERMLHAEFADCRVRGEWFRPSELLITYIEHHCGNSDGLRQLKPTHEDKLRAAGLPVFSKEVLAACSSLRAWAIGRPPEDRYFCSTLRSQILTAAKCPESKVTKRAVAAGAAEFAARVAAAQRSAQ